MTRRALITGAGKNIGKFTALALADRGFDIVLNGRQDEAICNDVAALIRGKGVRADVIMADVSVAGEVARLAEGVLALHDTVDVLVNNAARRPSGPFLDLPPGELELTINTNLLASARLIQALAPGMVAQRWGRIVNFTGMMSIGGHHGFSGATISKHGVWGLTKALALELAPHGVTVNAISPGPIRNEGVPLYGDEKMTAFRRALPTGRQGENAEVAAVVAFLCDDLAGYVSGQMIAVNGAKDMR